VKLDPGRVSGAADPVGKVQGGSKMNILNNKKLNFFAQYKKIQLTILIF